VSQSVATRSKKAWTSLADLAMENASYLSVVVPEYIKCCPPHPWGDVSSILTATTRPEIAVRIH
jgi:hypothetical protein